MRSIRRLGAVIVGGVLLAGCALHRSSSCCGDGGTATEQVGEPGPPECDAELLESFPRPGLLALLVRNASASASRGSVRDIEVRFSQMPFPTRVAQPRFWKARVLACGSGNRVCGVTWTAPSGAGIAPGAALGGFEIEVGEMAAQPFHSWHLFWSLGLDSCTADGGGFGGMLVD